MNDLLEWIAQRPKTLAWAAVGVLVASLLVLNTFWYVIKLADDKDTYLGVARYALREQEKTNKSAKQAREAIDDMCTLLTDDAALKSEALQPLRRDLLLRSLRYYREYLKLHEDQRPDDSDAKDAIADVAHAHFRNALLTSEIASREQAVKALTGARDFLQEAADPAAKDTTLCSELVAIYNHLGMLQSDNGQVKESLQTYQQAQRLLQQLVEKHPQRHEYEAALAATYNNVGNLQTDDNQPADALKSHQQALEMFQKLAHEKEKEKNDPGTYQSDIATTYNNLGNVQLRLQQTAEALKAHQQAQAIYQKLLERSPDNLTYQSDLASTLQYVGQSLDKAGKRDEAAATLQKAIERQKAVLDKEPSRGAARRQLSDHYFQLAKVQREAGRVKDAAATTQLRQQLWPKDGAELYQVASDWALLIPKAAEGERKQYADAAMEALKQAAANGYKDAEALKKNADLATLRERDDFKKLVAEMETKAKKEP